MKVSSNLELLFSSLPRRYCDLCYSIPCFANVNTLYLKACWKPYFPLSVHRSTCIYLGMILIAQPQAELTPSKPVVAQLWEIFFRINVCRTAAHPKPEQCQPYEEAPASYYRMRWDGEPVLGPRRLYPSVEVLVQGKKPSVITILEMTTPTCKRRNGTLARNRAQG